MLPDFCRVTRSACYKHSLNSSQYREPKIGCMIFGGNQRLLKILVGTLSLPIDATGTLASMGLSLQPATFCIRN